LRWGGAKRAAEKLRKNGKGNGGKEVETFRKTSLENGRK